MSRLVSVWESRQVSRWVSWYFREHVSRVDVRANQYFDE